MPSKLKKAIGAVKDQTSLGLALVVNNNSVTLDIAVLKATTHDAIPVEEKYVNEVLLLTSSSKQNAAACAQAIARRIGRTRNWIVALKSLMLVLRIFQDGDPYFPREVLHAMKGGAKILNLSSFRDDSNSSPWDYTAFIRTFALYLDERLECFLLGKLNRRAVYKEPNNHQRGGSRRRNEPVCDMKPPMLLDRISYWQRLLDRAIATRPTGGVKSNRLVQISLYSIVRESFDLYRDISDGLTLLLDSFFHLQYQSCVDAFQACIKASKQFEELSVFYTTCKNIGVGRTSEYPSVQKISDELIDALREFLKDQSSFSPGNHPRPPMHPAPPLLLPAPVPPSEHPNGGFAARFYDRRLSLEDLFSVVDAGANLAISTGQDRFGKQFSTKARSCFSVSPPVDHERRVSRGLDIVPFDQDQQPSVSETAVEQDQPGKQSLLDDLMDSNTKNEAAMDQTGMVSAGQDLVLFDDDDQQQSVSGAEAAPANGGGKEGWELMLVETANGMVVTSSSSPQEAFSQPSFLGSLYNQAPVHHVQQSSYNPFLQDTDGISDTSAIDLFGSETGLSSLPTFRATPTFCAQKSEDSTASAWQVENDPFAPWPPPQTDQILCDSTNQQQHFLHEQQLWLQNQNKIIARLANMT